MKGRSNRVDVIKCFVHEEPVTRSVTSVFLFILYVYLPGTQLSPVGFSGTSIPGTTGETKEETEDPGNPQ